MLLKQHHGWTYGILANHLWSVAGTEARPDVSATFLQPFLSYTTKKSTTFSINTESTYDWDNRQWTVPIIPNISHVVKLGKLPVSVGLGGKYYADGPRGVPDWGLRFTFTLLLPRGGGSK